MSEDMFFKWFLPGVWITIQVTLYSAAVAGVVAFVVGLARGSRLWIVRFLAGCYFEIFRGTSALILMIWVAYSLPLALGWQLVPLWAGTVALGLTYGAYGSEIVRGSLQSVTPAQREAGIALSFTRTQRLLRIELPQAWPEMLPPFNNLLIELLKGTSLVSVIAVADMTFAGNLVRLGSSESAPVYSMLLVVYFLLAFVLTRGMRLLERQAKARIGQTPEPSGLKNWLTVRRQGVDAAGAAKAGGVK